MFSPLFFFQYFLSLVSKVWVLYAGFCFVLTFILLGVLWVSLNCALMAGTNLGKLLVITASVFFSFSSPSDSPIQFSSVAQSCPTLCNPVNHSTPGFPVHQQILEFTQTHVHPVCNAIQPSHPLSFPSPPAPNPSQHQGLFQWVNSSHEVAKVLEFQLQHQSFQWTPWTDLL